jgi:uncharacterized protein involved in exopolysaccharide biosynthesis
LRYECGVHAVGVHYPTASPGSDPLVVPVFDLSSLLNRSALKRLAAVVSLSVALGAAFAFLAPEWFRSTLTVVPAKPQRGGGLSSLIGGDLASLAAGFDAGGLGGTNDVARIAAVVQSVGVSDAVIQKLGLQARYEKHNPESTRRELWEHCAVKMLPKPSLVELSCEDKDPQFVLRMLVSFAETGNDVFRRIGVSSASEEAHSFELRVAELRQKADESAANMQAFQEVHHIVDIDTQSKAVVSALAALNTARMAKQLDLGFAREFASPGEATTRQLESQLSVIDEQLRTLEDPGTPAAPSQAAGKQPRGARGSGLFPAALAVPELRAQYEKLFRDRKVSEMSLVFALEHLEGAKASAARDVSTFLVLDPPALPTIRARPQRSFVLAVSVLLGVVLALVDHWIAYRGGIATLLSAVGIAPRRRASHSEPAVVAKRVS